MCDCLCPGQRLHGGVVRLQEAPAAGQEEHLADDPHHTGLQLAHVPLVLHLFKGQASPRAGNDQDLGQVRPRGRHVCHVRHLKRRGRHLLLPEKEFKQKFNSGSVEKLERRLSHSGVLRQPRPVALFKRRGCIFGLPGAPNGRRRPCGGPARQNFCLLNRIANLLSQFSVCS